MPLARPTTGARDDYAALADLWIEGINAPHDAGCACGGLFALSLDRTSIERDFLQILAARYRDEQRDALLTLVENRLAHVDATPFDAWLAGLRDAPLADEARARLVADLRVFLESLASAGRRGVGPCY